MHVWDMDSMSDKTRYIISDQVRCTQSIHPRVDLHFCYLAIRLLHRNSTYWSWFYLVYIFCPFSEADPKQINNIITGDRPSIASLQGRSPVIILMRSIIGLVMKGWNIVINTTEPCNNKGDVAYVHTIVFIIRVLQCYIYCCCFVNSNQKSATNLPQTLEPTPSLPQTFD